MRYASHLEKIGLTPGESKVYEALLELGQSSITKIIKKSSISTSKSYDILHRLEQKGLVSRVIFHNVRYFKAAHPQRLADMLMAQKKEIEDTIDDFNGLIPALISKARAREAAEEAEIFVGIEGLITLFNEETAWMQKTKRESLVIGATKGAAAGKEVNDFFRRLQAKRDMLKVKTKFVFNKALKGKFSYLEQSNFCHIKYIESGSDMTSINMFDDKTVIAIYAQKPFLFVIKSEKVTNDFRAYFQELWKRGKK